jgi:NAD-dependent deacetylase
VWDWYAARREKVAAASPNAGHRALADLEMKCERSGAAFILITQNVDGLHHASGSREILELHGNIRRVKCFDAGHPAASWEESGARPPRCRVCGSLLRPDVVWFGEMLPEGAMEAAVRAARECDVLLSVGTSGLVEPAASLPFVALEAGAAVIEVNPDATPLTPRATLSLRGAAGEILPRIVE